MVGAGPGGCATALHLAGRGHEVVILERARRPADKVCGEGLMPHGVAALARLGVGMPEGQPVVGIGYHAGGRSAVGRFPGGLIGLGVRRSVLDAHLVQAVARLPRVTLRRGAQVRAIRAVPGDVHIGTDCGTVRVRAVVGADGFRSTVRREAGLQGRATGRRRYGVRRHLRLADLSWLAQRVHVHAGEGSELYLTHVAPDIVNVALLCDRSVMHAFKGRPRQAFHQMLARWPAVADRLAGAEPVSEVRTCGPLRQVATDVVGDSLMLVGDAAGFVDAVTGEGMSLTLLSAELAAEVLSRALRRGRLGGSDLRPYAVRRRRMARHLSWLTEIVVRGLRHPWLARRVVGNLGRHPDVFQRVLAVNTGQAPLWSVGPSLWRLLA